MQSKLRRSGFQSVFHYAPGISAIAYALSVCVCVCACLSLKSLLTFSQIRTQFMALAAVSTAP